MSYILYEISQLMNPKFVRHMLASSTTLLCDHGKAGS